MSKSFPDLGRVTRETAPMRNSCDVLYDYGRDGVSHANLVISYPGDEGSTREFELRFDRKIRPA